jgi:hypothetical protein
VYDPDWDFSIPLLFPSIFCINVVLPVEWIEEEGRWRRIVFRTEETVVADGCVNSPKYFVRAVNDEIVHVRFLLDKMKEDDPDSDDSEIATSSAGDLFSDVLDVDV